MIDKATAIPLVMQRLEKLKANECIELKTYKRNRSLLLIKKSNGLYRVYENGFYSERFEVDQKQMPRLLKNLFKKEFPRSTKIRLYSLGEFKNEFVQGVGRKII